MFRYNTRIIKSKRAGMGKSLFIKKQSEKLYAYLKRNATDEIRKKLTLHHLLVKIPVLGTSVDIDEVVNKLSKHGGNQEKIPRIYHFDIASTVRHLSIN